MSFIEKTEKKFGKFAIHGLSLKLVVLQCTIFLLMSNDPNPVLALLKIEQSISFLNIGNTHFITDFLLLAGMPVCYPINAMTYIMLFFGSYILLMCGNGLESLWGTYKFNIFVLFNIILGVVTLHIVRVTSFYDLSNIAFFPATAISMNVLSLLHMSLFIAFAVNFPKTEIRAMLILPVTFGFLGLVETGIALYIIFNCPTVPMMTFYFSTILLPTLLFHYKLYFQKQAQRIRTAEFTRKVTAVDRQAFHVCHACGKTENDNIEFRIADDGEEYCLEHLK